jgi:hypothetical protein
MILNLDLVLFPDPEFSEPDRVFSCYRRKLAAYKSFIVSSYLWVLGTLKSIVVKPEPECFPVPDLDLDTTGKNGQKIIK